MKRKLHTLVLVMLLPLWAWAQEVIRLPYITVTSASVQNLPYTGGNLNIPVSYSVNISGYEDIYMELMNDALINHGQDGYFYVSSLLYNSINISVQQNSYQNILSFYVAGNSGNQVTVNLAAAPAPPDPPEPDPLFSITGNWRFTKTYTKKEGANVEDITFYDALGYPEQIIQVAASAEASPKNIVTPIYYDPVRRSDARNYLPYVSGASTKLRESAPFTAQQSFYNGSQYGSGQGSYAFTQNTYEPSAMNRITARKNVGSDFSNKQSTISYDTNTATEVWKLQVNTSGSLVVTSTSKHPAGSLYKNTVTDEDGEITITFTNKDGRTVLARKEISSGTYADTYYIYDDYGRLAWVITPEGAAIMPTTTQSPTSAFALNYCYIYTYDGRGNVVEKAIPGKGAEYYVYDKGNRMVLSQDAEQRKSNYWVYYVYDNFNQLIDQNLVLNKKTANTRPVLQAAYLATAFNNSYPTLGGISSGDYPISSADFEKAYTLTSIRYYGHRYGAAQTAFALPSGIAFAPVSGVVASTDLESSNNKGLKMYEKASNLNTPATFVERAFYYDYLGRLIQIVEKNALSGTSRTSMQYDLMGTLLAQHESHQSSATATADTKQTSFIYDPRGRLLSESTVITANGVASAPATINYTYDKLGLLLKKTYGNGVEENLTYNIQGWLTGKSAKKGTSNIFDMNLRYYTKTQTSSVARYNGNMAEWEWQQGSQPKNLYSFTYDKLGRLTTTNRWAGGTANNSYTERDIVYNRNGDITALKRYGTTATVIDNNLSYTYTANKLSQLQDASSVYTYAHDANGNITTDGRRGYNISYNVLNLPKEVKQSGTIKATYTYLADGTKAGVVDNAGNGNDYLGSLIYTRSGGSLTLESAAFGSGRIYRNGSSFDVQYYSTDHLGSTRAITNSAGTVIEQNDYYPFGLRHSNSTLTTSAANRFRFSGKEEQTKFATNFNYLDFGARMYDPVIGRWNTMDPLAEKYYEYSPYTYTLNNPVNLIDPNGMQPFDPTFFIQKFFDLMNWMDTQKEALQRLSTGQSGQMHPETGAPQQVQNMQKTMGTLQDVGTVAQGVVDVAETSLDVVGTVPGVETVTDIMGAAYYGLKGDEQTAAFYTLGIGVTGVSGAMIKNAAKGVTYTKSSLALGREVHAGYKLAEHAPALGRFKEFTGIKGIRPDFVDFGTKTIFELKPFNPRGIQLGTKQLNNYKSLFEQNYGGTWKTVLDHY